MVRSMKKRNSLLLLGCLVSGLLLVSCGEDNSSSSQTTDETAYAYCIEYYNASFGNYGSFAIGAMEGVELETDFSDLTKFTLGDAFSGMRIESAQYSDDNYIVSFDLTGSLAEGSSGSIEGEGIVKGRSVKIDVPIAEAYMSSETVIYEGLSEQEVTLELTNSCFNTGLTASDFALTGAAKNMSVKAVSVEQAKDEEGNDALPQTAVLTLSGDPDGTDYAYIEVKSSALTYNKNLSVSLKTDVRGVFILNDNIDTFSLTDVLSIEATNIDFNESITKDDVTFGGVLKDYATVKSIERVSSKLITLTLAFPYTYLESESGSNIGYVKLSSEATSAGKEVVCSALVGVPEIKSDIKINGKAVTMELVLENGEWNLLGPSPFQVCNPDGSEVIVSELSVVNLDESLSIKFNLPDDCSGLLYFTLENAYSVVSSDGGSVDVSVKTYFYI